MSVFANRHSFLYGRNEPLVRYCFLWLLYGRGERFVQYCFLWRSCADTECNVYVSWVYHLAAKQGCTNVRVWLPKLGGLNIFCAHVSRGYLWASPIFYIFFKNFVDVENRTNVTSLIGFFCTRTYTREIWRASRAEFLFTLQVSLWNRSRSLHVRVKGVDVLVLPAKKLQQI